MLDSFNKLNEYQHDAVINEDRFLLLNASVGSGKTTVLVHKVLYLYHEKKIPINDMIVLTFTNKASEEIKKRILSSDNTGLGRKELSLFGTFHSVARYLLSNVLPVEMLGYTKDFTIIDQNGIEELFESTINKYNIDIKYRKRLEKRLEAYKNGKVMYGSMKYEDEIEKFIEKFNEEKLKRNVMDFDDLISNAGKLLKSGHYKASWVIIDEFQDTDKKQLDMIDGLIGDETHVFAVGDPNQIIYSWRGSSKDVFYTFKHKYDAVEKSLPVNYRSSGTIIDAAKVFLDKPMSLEGVRDKGALITIKRHHNSFNEAIYLADVIKKLHESGVMYKEIAVFYRMQKQSGVFEDVFKKSGIPYEVSVRKTLKDVPALYWFIRLFKASLNDKDIDSLLYVIKDNRYGLDLSPKQVEKLMNATDKKGKDESPVLLNKIRCFKEWSNDLKLDDDFESKIYGYYDMDNYISPTSISYSEECGIILNYLNEVKCYISMNKYSIMDGLRKAVDYAMLYGRGIISEIIDPENESVKLMTLHASKGLEFKYVFISGANYGIIPLGGRYDDEEEKRLFFVGITRARDYLEISYHSNPEDYKALPLPSPYLNMIPDELIDSDELKSRSQNLSDLRKQIKNNIDSKNEKPSIKKRMATHEKYGDGYIIFEDDNTYIVEFEGYGEKSFSKMFCQLKVTE